MTLINNMGTILVRTLIASSVILLFSLSGCTTVGPDYVPPDTSLPVQWHVPETSGLEGGRLNKNELAAWWSVFNDPGLTHLIEASVSGNLGLKEARARLRESRARYGLPEADRYPAVDAGGSIKTSRSSGSERERYTLGLDATWELDLFGGTRRAIEAAEADFQANEEDLRDTLVSLLAEVALNYVEVRSLQTRLSVATSNLEAQEETFRIAQWRLEAGLTTQFDVEQAKYSLEQTRAKLPDLQASLAQTKNNLALLLGRHPGFLEATLADGDAIPSAPMETAVGVPADVLRQRPDVRRAERQLAAQTAQIGVATADLYPKFSLIGSIGLEAFSINNLFLWENRSHSIGPTVSWPLFDAGAIRNNIEVQTALQEQALIQYETAVLTALKEVENAMVAYSEEQRRRHTLDKAAQAAMRALKLAQNQYSSGLIAFSNVLIAQQALLSLQDQLAVSDGQVTSDLIALYKALGGGWSSLFPDDERLAQEKKHEI